MKVRDTVFGSGPERHLYKALESAWPDRITLYPSLPLLSIINTSGARLSADEFDYLKKASVDYTACDKEDRPLLSVEFDGLGHGYNRNAEYIEWVGGADPYRSLKMNLKLRVAEEVAYPLFVVSYDEASPIIPDDQLTITHAVIGRCLMHMHVPALIEERVQASNLDVYPAWERDDLFQDIVTDAETDMELEWDLLAMAAARAHSQIWGRFGSVVKSVGYEYLHDEPVSSFFDVEAVKRRVRRLQQAHRVGYRVTIEHTAGKMAREAWVRNIQGQGVSALMIARELAELLACRAFLNEN